MTTIDIVDELRAGEDDPYIPHRTGIIMRDAADEIERLRGETVWEYGTSIPEAIEEDGFPHSSRESAESHIAACRECVLVRRRVVGPWERVEENDDD